MMLYICAKGMVHIKTFKSIFAAFCLIGIAVLSNIFLGNEKYMLTAVIAAIITLIPFFMSFEKKRINTRELILIAVMISLCVASRAIFILIPHFKPVTAMVIIVGMYFGGDAGFITGSFTALISNFQYGQGPWTVFQMAVWGLIGFLAGFLNTRGLLNKNKLILTVFSFICGVVFSLIMDIYTTISLDSSFSVARYLMYVSSSVPVMAEYAISNVIFILILNKPIGKKLERIKIKYGIFT